MLARVTFFFANGSNGWTETFYNTGADLETVLTTAQGMIRRRTDLLAKNAQLQYIRVSDDLVAGDSRLAVVPLTDRFNKNPAEDTGNAAYDGVLIRLVCSAMHRRMFIMRGIPDQVMKNNEFDPDPPWANALVRWFGLLVGATWGMKIVDRVTVLEKPITSLTNNWVPGTVTATVGSTAGWSNGDLVNIYGRMNCRGFRGLYRVRNLTATTFDVSTRRDVSGYNGNGKVRRQEYTILPFINQGVVMRLAKRSTGRPSFQERGRRSALPRV